MLHVLYVPLGKVLDPFFAAHTVSLGRVLNPFFCWTYCISGQGAGSPFFVQYVPLGKVLNPLFLLHMLYPWAGCWIPFFCCTYCIPGQGAGSPLFAVRTVSLRGAGSFFFFFAVHAVSLGRVLDSFFLLHILYSWAGCWIPFFFASHTVTTHYTSGQGAGSLFLLHMLYPWAGCWNSLFLLHILYPWAGCWIFFFLLHILYCTSGQGACSSCCPRLPRPGLLVGPDVDAGRVADGLVEGGHEDVGGPQVARLHVGGKLQPGGNGGTGRRRRRAE